MQKCTKARLHGRKEVETVSRYIDVDELKKLIEEEFNGVCVYDVSPDEAISDFCDAVDNCPSADVAPVVHGHWKYERDEGHSIYTGECSVCGYRRRIDPFCGRCGAKMDESEVNNNE